MRVAARPTAQAWDGFALTCDQDAVIVLQRADCRVKAVVVMMFSLKPVHVATHHELHQYGFELGYWLVVWQGRAGRDSACWLSSSRWSGCVPNVEVEVKLRRV
ncbi:MAG: hypothetical protein JWP77_2526 [Polaromonas sp.]|nr:hypothetical protein [Polaromonas sp.]